MNYYDHFIIPFTVGVFALFAIILYKYLRWFLMLPREDRKLVGRSIFTRKSIDAVGEVFMESLLHRRIFRTNPMLGYMHMSLAFGWFLLITVGWMETAVYLGGEQVPLHVHVFFKYFSTGLNHDIPIARFFSTLMDLLLLFVLSGVALAWFKRMRSRTMGIRRPTKHTIGDKVALSVLWFIFPLRLLAESATSGLYHSGGFLTGTVGEWLYGLMGEGILVAVTPVLWWSYSVVLCVFMVSLPFSRYMHIFTEIPLIFLRRYKIRSGVKSTSYDNFQIAACSRCGICIDPCQLQADAGIQCVQSVYFLRDRRQGKLTDSVAGNCLMCGRCEIACPVGIELNTLRLNSREKMINAAAEGRYSYLGETDYSEGEGRVGYFAGCMTLLTPSILKSMERIFDASGENVWWADRDGGVCCGRPLKLSGEVDAAQIMMQYNRDLFVKHNITTLITSCPICLKVFREDYLLEGIKVLHHSQYIEQLISDGRITPVYNAETLYTYHDPCELGRGSGVYEPPREVIASVGQMVEMSESRDKALCCGSSIANTSIDDIGQNAISKSVALRLAATGADAVVTSCPLCKKAIVRNATVPVYDLSEIVAASI